VALDGALKKFHQKRKRKIRVIVFRFFFVLFLSGQKNCGVGNHAFFRPMNKIVFFLLFFFYLHMVLRDEEKNFLKFFLDNFLKRFFLACVCVAQKRDYFFLVFLFFSSNIEGN